jgi:arginase family enzyme
LPQRSQRTQRNSKNIKIFKKPRVDELVKSRNSIEFVIPAKAGIQLFQDVLDPGACPGPDPGFAGVTLQETFYEIIKG